MSRIYNIDTETLLVIRDGKTITYYNKNGVSVSVVSGNLVLTLNGRELERLSIEDLDIPTGDAIQKADTIRGYLDEYIPDAKPLSDCRYNDLLLGGM